MIAFLGPHSPFPPVESALNNPNGLLAMGGELSSERLLDAYRHGIFPWYSEDEPVLWWSPDPRAIFWVETFEASRRLRRQLRRGDFTFSINHAFEQVMRGCAEPRPGQPETWITEEMISAYTCLHGEGFAHSVEVWLKGRLVGGIYGLAIGRFFFGESMFSRVSNASKAAHAVLMQQLKKGDFLLLDSQVPNEHTSRLGAVTMRRQTFKALLADNIDKPMPNELWQPRALVWESD